MHESQTSKLENRMLSVETNTHSIPIFSRVWEMPNSNTFDIRCIKKLIYKYFTDEMISIDPFANKSKLAKITNDLNPEYGTDYNMDAVDFLKLFDDNSVDFVFYDPPYSLRQVSECYKNFGIPVTMQTTQSSWKTKHRNEIARVLKPNGIVMCFGWNSSGVGKKRGCELIEVLLVAHGGSHNDTICTVERKLS
jgi:16S rRNA G966 N2-methylase RsmD